MLAEKAHAATISLLPRRIHIYRKSFWQKISIQSQMSRMGNIFRMNIVFRHLPKAYHLRYPISWKIKNGGDAKALRQSLRFMSDYLEAEFYSSAQIRQLQEERLPQAVQRAAQAPFYAQLFAALSLAPERIKSVNDLSLLPFTTKEDLRAAMPYGLLAVPREHVVRMHYSSGTTGMATAVFHTSQDLRLWAECVARGMQGVGVTAADVFQNMMSYGLFTGGLGFHYAAELIGCLTIPAGAGHTARQIQLMREFGTTVLHILPSYALRVAQFCQEHGIEVERDLALRIGFAGAEPFSEKTRQRIEQALHIKLYNCYGLSEMCGPGVAMECPVQEGLHIREDHYWAEIIDPETLQPVPDGQPGELVLTSLTREAMPLLRYRTRDVTRFLREACPCGRAHRRIAPIMGRTDDMLIVRGVNFYPLQVERVLMSIPEIGSNYLIRLQTVQEMDDMIVEVELRPQLAFDDMRRLEALREHIVERLRQELLFTPRVKIHPPHTLPVSEGKAVRVQDERTK